MIVDFFTVVYAHLGILCQFIMTCEPDKLSKQLCHIDSTVNKILYKHCYYYCWHCHCFSLENKITEKFIYLFIFLINQRILMKLFCGLGMTQ